MPEQYLSLIVRLIFMVLAVTALFAAVAAALGAFTGATDFLYLLSLGPA